MNEVIEKLIWILYLIGTIVVGCLVIYGIFYLMIKIDIERSNECIENGGTVVTDKAGYFDRCIYGG